MTVFAVLAHGDPSTFRLTSELLAPHPVVVHVDAATDLIDYPGSNHITYVSERTRVHWGGFSAVSAMIAVFEAAIERVSTADEYVVLISGQCVPLRPIDSLNDYLGSQHPRQLCNAGILLDGHERNENRVRRAWHFDQFDARVGGLHQRVNAVARALIRLLKQPVSVEKFDGLQVVAGSQWTAFSAGCLRDLLARKELNERLASLLKHSLAPDEIYFHSLLYSSPWSSHGSSQPLAPKADLRTADFANLHYIDRSLNAYLDADDIMRASLTGAYFARKVDITRNPDVATVVKRLTQIAR